ncbi:MAG TPA: wax ester/triacylglycerol synthase family O-acyltransferase [Candidatus Binataceae bacterium]|nr:wax ester/triacylglycerol synthase family O-acyltransferase [Candidatus Binataceae bacterium]
MAGKDTPSHRHRFSTQDATFIYAETPNNPLHIGSILMFEGKIDFDDFVQHVESRLHLIPRYRQRMMRVPFNLGHAVLEDDPDFRIENHVIRHLLRPGMNQAEAIDEMLRHYETPLDYKRPLWEMHSFENLEGARTAIVSKVHHALVDGVSGVELLKVMFDLKPVPDPIEPQPWQPEKPSTPVQRFLEAAREAAAGQMKAMMQTSREMMRDPETLGDEARSFADGFQQLAQITTRRIVSTPWNSGLVGQRRSLAWSTMSFGDFRRIRNAFGGSINDVVLTILTEAAARYLQHHGYAANGRLCIGCPVNVRHKEEATALGNRVSMMFPMLPSEPMDLVERLRYVNAETERIKDAQLPQTLERLMSIADNIPPTLMGAGSRLSTMALNAASTLFKISGYKPRPDGFLLPTLGINFIATNVPGVQVPQYLFGHKCLEQVPLVPCGATLGYNVAILSYNSTLCFGMSADPNLMPDVSLMKFFVDEIFSELKERAQVAQAAKEAAASPSHSAAAGGA